MRSVGPGCRLPRYRLPADRPADAGFSLIESVVAVVIIAVIVVSAGPVFSSALQGSTGLGSKQAAIALANQQLDQVRSVSSDSLVAGREASDVAALIAAPGLVDLGNDVTASGNSDPEADPGSADAAVKLTTSQALNGATYTIRTYINTCYLSKSTGRCTPATANGPAAWRVSVDVSWIRAAGVNCASGRSGQCEFVASTLIDLSRDPVFSLSAAPTITLVQDFSTGSAVALGPIHPGQQLTLKVTGTNFRTGMVATSGNGDVLGTVTGNTGMSFTIGYQASSVVGTRNLVLTNTNGTSATTTMAVTKSTPTVTAMTPTTIRSGQTTTMTLTGTDFFATPTTATATAQPSVTLTGTATLGGVTIPFTVAGSAETVVSSTKLTFTLLAAGLSPPYTAKGTLTLVNPDGGTATYAFIVSVTA